MDERTLSLSEVAGLMGVSERTIRRWIKAGKLRAYKPGRDYRIPESAVRALVEESEISPKVLAPPSLFNGLEEERRIAEALWDPASSEDAFRQAVEAAPTDALHARADELVRDYHTPPEREGLRSQPSGEVISRVKAFARATIVGEELKRRGEKPPERHNLALKRFEDAMSDEAPRYEEREGQEAG